MVQISSADFDSTFHQKSVTSHELIVDLVYRTANSDDRRQPPMNQSSCSHDRLMVRQSRFEQENIVALMKNPSVLMIERWLFEHCALPNQTRTMQIRIPAFPSSQAFPLATVSLIKRFVVWLKSSLVVQLYFMLHAVILPQSKLNWTSDFPSAVHTVSFSLTTQTYLHDA